MKKTKYLAACIAAVMALLIIGCGSGDDDEHGIDYDAEKWAIAGTTLVRYTGAEADVRVPDGVTVIGEYAFKYREGVVTSVTLPESVKIIEDSAFYGCARLASVKMPGSVTMLGEYAFYECASLASVTIPDSVTSIGDYAFSGCASLASVTIPDSVKSIGYMAFAQCYLESLTIGKGVESIGLGAFVNLGVSKLMEVNYGGAMEQWRSIKNSSDNGGATITGVIFSCTGDGKGENVIIVCQDGKLRWVEADSNWIRKPDPSTQ